MNYSPLWVFRGFPAAGRSLRTQTIKDQVTLKPRADKSLAVAQSSRECGGIATLAAANGTRVNRNDIAGARKL
jgi:hypothetical protein